MDRKQSRAPSVPSDAKNCTNLVTSQKINNFVL